MAFYVIGLTLLGLVILLERKWDSDLEDGSYYRSVSRSYIWCLTREMRLVWESILYRPSYRSGACSWLSSKMKGPSVTNIFWFIREVLSLLLLWILIVTISILSDFIRALTKRISQWLYAGHKLETGRLVTLGEYDVFWTHPRAIGS